MAGLVRVPPDHGRAGHNARMTTPAPLRTLTTREVKQAADARRVAQEVLDAPNTDLIGQAGNIAVSYDSNTSKRINVSQPADPNIDLQFPQSVVVYREMLRTDGQVGGIMRAIKNAIKKADWHLNTTGVDQDMIDLVTEDLGDLTPGSDEDPAPNGDRVSKFDFQEHLGTALDFLGYGFSAHEQQYRPVLVESDTGELSITTHLYRMLPLLQKTIQTFEVSDDGQPAALYQQRRPGDTQGNIGGPIRLDITRLLLYSYEPEGADLSGTSLLRTAYKYWRVNDVLIRLAAQIVERNGMGVPVVDFDPEIISKEEALEAGREWRAGGTAALAAPPGVSITLKGVQGMLVDPLPLMKYMDESIARSVLAMFMNLGHDAGARSLGETFVDAFTDSLQQVADFVAGVFNRYVIARLVHHNRPGAAYPRLSPGRLIAQTVLPPEQLAAYANAGFIRPDADTEAWIRSKRGMPKAGTPYAEADTTPTDTGPDAGSVAKLEAETRNAQANVLGTLFRSGVQPDDAARAAGLGELVGKHTGLLPVTLKSADDGTQDNPEDVATKPAPIIAPPGTSVPAAPAGTPTAPPPPAGAAPTREQVRTARQLAERAVRMAELIDPNTYGSHHRAD